MQSTNQIVEIREVRRVVPKHQFNGAPIAEKGGEGAEAGIQPDVEVTPEGDENA